MSQIHIIDGQKDIILDFITAKNIIDDTHRKSLLDTLETYQFITFADKRFSEFLEKRNRIIIPDEDGSLREFVISIAEKYKDTEGHKAQVVSLASYLELKKASILYPGTFEGTASQHGGRALNDSGWQIGIVEGKGTRKLTIENHTNPYEMLKRIAKEFELELRFRVEHDGNKITGRYVDLLERVGEWRGREVEFGKDLDGIRRIEKQDIVTALLGLGPEDDDGKRLEVLVEDDEALQRWGRIDEHGNLKHLIEPYEIQSERTEMTKEEARQYTRTALDKRINTQVTFETTIIDLENVPGMENKKIRFGDTIKIKDTTFIPPLYLEARVFEQDRSIKSKAKKDIKLGDYIEHTEEEVNAIWKQLQKQIQNRVSYYEMVEHTYDRLTIDTKDETVFEDGKSFAEATGIIAEENAKAFAVEEDSKIKVDVKDYADNVSEEKAQSALDQAKMYAVAKTVYDNEMQQIANDISERAPIEYVDGKFTVVEDNLKDFNAKLENKADGSTVYTISEVDNMINNTVSITQYTADMNGVVTDLNSHGTRLGQNEKAIGLKADSSELNTIEQSLTTKIGNVEVTAEGAKMSASEVRADLDGLEIGGRNYVLDSEKEIYKTSGHGHTNLVLSELRTALNGKNVVVSFEAKHDKGNREIPLHAYYRDKAGGNLGFSYAIKDGKRQTTTTKYERFEIPINDDMIPSDLTDYINLAIRNGDTTDKWSFKNVQLEKGNRATDWSPAPEDIEGHIDQVTGRVETLDASVTTLAGEVSLKASQSIVDSLEGRVSTAEGSLSVLPGQINAKVSKDGVIGEINASPESLKINFGRLDISGKVTFSTFDSATQNRVKTGETAKSTIDSNQTTWNRAGNINANGTLNTSKLSGTVSDAQVASGSKWNTASTNASNVKSLTDTWKYGNTTEIDGGSIRTKTITANEINVNSLSALSANLGTVTAGNIKGIGITGSLFTMNEVLSGEDGVGIYGRHSYKELSNSYNAKDIHGEMLTNGAFISFNSKVKIQNSTTEYWASTHYGSSALKMRAWNNSSNNNYDGNFSSLRDRIDISPAQITLGQIGHTSSPDWEDSIRIRSRGQIYASDFIQSNEFRVDGGSIYGRGGTRFFIDPAYIGSLAAYSRTSTATSNMLRVTDNGVINRSTSSRRYKLVEETVDLDYAKKILGLNAVTWFDKRVAEDYCHTLTTGEATEVQRIERIGGVIAEDVHDLGLGTYVSYDDDSRPDGISANLWTLLIPIVKRQQIEIDNLKKVLNT